MRIQPTQWQMPGRWFICWLFILVAMVSSLSCAQEVENTQDSTRALFQEKHQVWLKHCQRPEVWRHSRGDVFVNNEPFQQIIRLGIPALPYLMERIEEAPIEGRLLHHALMAITKKKFHVRQEEIDGQLLWTVEEFPDIAPGKSHPDTNILWLRWWREKIQETPEEFERLYQEWKAQKEPDEAEGAYRKLVDLGVVALPAMVKKVAGGEIALLPAISKLSEGAIPEDAERTECLAWWELEEEKWTITFPDAQEQLAPKDTAAVAGGEQTP